VIIRAFNQFPECPGNERRKCPCPQRDAEWTGLAGFAADARPGATLGVVSGRRRQGKSYLLQALATALSGIYFPALELTETVSLRLFADELIRFSGSPVPPFRDWLDVIPYLFRLAGDRVVPVVIDEFPYLVKASPGLPSISQRELGPGGSGSASRVRLLLCGSAMSVMGGLLSGPAPLRGRASNWPSTPSATGTRPGSGRLPTPSWPYSCIRWWAELPHTDGNFCAKTPPRTSPTSTHG
jgi:hypothetical protein